MTSIGFVGLGNVFYVSHLPTLSSIEGIRFAWGYDRNADRGRRICGIVGMRCLDGGVDDAEAVDIVLVTVPFGARDGLTERLKGKARALYYEKPFALSERQHLALCQGFPDWAVAIGYQRRAQQNVRFARHLIRTMALGAVRHVECTFGSIATASGGYLSDLGLAGGGILFETGSHWIDTVLYMLGAEDPDVQPRVNTCTMLCDGGFDIYTKAQIDIAKKDDVIPLTLTASSISNEEHTARIFFDHSVLEINPFTTDMPRLRSLEDGSLVRLESPPWARSTGGVYTVLHEYWMSYLNGLRNEEINYTNAIRSLNTTKVIEQLYSMGKQEA